MSVMTTEEKGGQPVGEDLTFRCLGSKIRVLVDPSDDPTLPTPEAAAQDVREFIERFDRTLSRFREDSELTAFNTDPRETVPASGLLRTLVRAGIWAAQRTDGLVDPTLQAEIERAGYRESRAGAEGLSAGELLEETGPRIAASASPSRNFDAIEVDDEAGTISRPPGVSIDPGGVGKGLAADMAAGLLEGYPRYLVSCGGDIRVGGGKTAENPFEVFVENPVSGRKPHFFRLGSGGIATSGTTARSWRNADGKVAHHLLDPSSGRPSRTGLISCTALAPSALEAEVLAKQALLSGPEEAGRILGGHGGILVHEDGAVEVAGESRIRFRIPSQEDEESR